MQVKEELFSELNLNQKKAVFADINSCTKIAAGAGSGKTKVIASRFLKLVLDMKNAEVQNPAEKILVITFTDKAAKEMKERILKTLNENNINTFGQKLWISTFHSFASRILKAHSVEINLNPDFELVEEITAEEIYSEIVNKIKNAKYDKEQIAKLTQKLGLEENILEQNNLKPLLLVHEMEELFSEILKIIKNIKAKGLTPKEFLDITIDSINNFTSDISKLYEKQYSKEDYALHFSKILNKYSTENIDFMSVSDKIIGSKTIIMKNGARKAEQWALNPEFYENLHSCEQLEILFTKITSLIYALYQEELLSRSLLDFDDLINKTIEIFKTKPKVLDKYKKQFKHIIIDEFQDTNGAQLELTKFLCADEYANITFVGDKKQSIYAFRYAQSENLDVLSSVLEKKYNTTYPKYELNINYRSSDKVLEAVNTLVENHLKLDEKLLVGKHNFKETKVTKHVFKNVQSMAVIQSLEAEYIANEIIRLKEKTNFNYNDFAILVDTHREADFIEKYLSKNNIAAIKAVNKSFFESSNIKNYTFALSLADNKYNEYALVKVLLANMNQEEVFCLQKQLNNKFSDEEKYKLNFAQKFFHENAQETVLNFSEHTKKIHQLFSKNLKFKNTHDVFLEILKELKLINHSENWKNTKAQIEIKVLEKIITNWQTQKHYAPVALFLNYLKDISKNTTFELPKVILNDINAVNIMTVHASKGLEFECVFVTKSVAKKKPGGRGKYIFDISYEGKTPFGIIFNNEKNPKSSVYKRIWQNPREDAENLRLFYVAISRAKSFLYLTSHEAYASVVPQVFHDIIDEAENVE